MKKLGFVFLFFLISEMMVSQNLNEYRWKNRVLLLIGQDTGSSDFKVQMNLLRSNINDLEERKLVVLTILPHEYTVGLNEMSPWEKGDQVYLKYGEKEESFKVLLIGLDGGVKISQKEPILVETLKEMIDIMPMRRSEIENKN
ncbi:MAG: DUF4174 domain-containing protein [Lutimonas sp.]